MLPDDVLLAMFGFCANEGDGWPYQVSQVWQTLVHVCRRWRCLVFEFPHSLNLQLICTARTPEKDMLDVWPPLPLIIQPSLYPIENVDNIVAVLQHRNRVCQIHTGNMPSSHLEKVLAEMQEPFPELTYLELRFWPYGEMGPVAQAVLPDSFMGGSTPRLRQLRFSGIPFPGLPKLLLSATHLTTLRLEQIPHSGFILPEAMVTALSTLICLRTLHLGSKSPLSLPDRASRPLPPPKRFIIPVLTHFWFQGVSEYVDDLVARIDAPRLIEFDLNFFNQILFDTPELVQFISRTSTLKAPEKARVIFKSGVAKVHLSSRAYNSGVLCVEILCEKWDWQVSSLEQVCTSCLPPLSTLKNLYISDGLFEDFLSDFIERADPRPNWQDIIENTLWLELLQSFATVKNLYLSEEFTPCIMLFLQELVMEGTAEVLPALKNIFVDELKTSRPVQKAIQQFVAARQASNHIAVSRWVGMEGR